MIYNNFSLFTFLHIFQITEFSYDPGLVGHPGTVLEVGRDEAGWHPISFLKAPKPSLCLLTVAKSSRHLFFLADLKQFPFFLAYILKKENGAYKITSLSVCPFLPITFEPVGRFL
jgi:hypothetical protein